MRHADAVLGTFEKHEFSAQELDTIQAHSFGRNAHAHAHDGTTSNTTSSTSTAGTGYMGTFFICACVWLCLRIYLSICIQKTFCAEG
jgi:hypothetical protein